MFWQMTAVASSDPFLETNFATAILFRMTIPDYQLNLVSALANAVVYKAPDYYFQLNLNR